MFRVYVDFEVNTFWSQNFATYYQVRIRDWLCRRNDEHVTLIMRTLKFSRKFTQKQSNLRERHFTETWLRQNIFFQLTSLYEVKLDVTSSEKCSSVPAEDKSSKLVHFYRRFLWYFELNLHEHVSLKPSFKEKGSLEGTAVELLKALWTSLWSDSPTVWLAFSVLSVTSETEIDILKHKQTVELKANLQN